MAETKHPNYKCRKITHKGLKFGCTAAYLLYVYLLYSFSAPCLYQKLFGIPCPGCGMTRAYLSLLHLDFAAAFSNHPMFWSVPILYLYILYDGRLFKNQKVNFTVLLLIGLGFLIQYVYKLCLWFS